MFIVKNKAEVAKFGLFVLLAGTMAYFVATRFAQWQVSESPQPKAGTALPVTAMGSSPAAPEDVAVDESDYFAEYRITRDRTRSALQETMQKVIDSPQTDAEIRKRASEQLMQLSVAVAKEREAETMVKAKGFQDVVVHLGETSAQVVVRASALTQQQAVQVIDMVSHVANIKPAEIQVFARER